MAKRKKSAKLGGINKSQAIRDALRANPESSPKQLSADLNAKGIKVSPAFVSIVKSAAKAKSSRGGRSMTGRGSNGGRGGSVVADQLIEAKKLVDRVGGIEKAESLLGTLRKLM